jgi:toxin-antitoxin system PIN domain toxin
MAVALLDVNILLALFWRPHRHHAIAQNWFLENEKKGWATCPMTQASFVRIISNPAFSENPPHPAQASELLDENLRNPHHRFWIDDLSIAEALASVGKRVTNHQQIPDAYLLALAMRNRGSLVTFDGGIANLLPETQRKSGLIVHLPTNTR